MVAKECADLVQFGLAMSNTSVICVGTNPTCHVSDSTEQCDCHSRRDDSVLLTHSLTDYVLAWKVPIKRMCDSRVSSDLTKYFPMTFPWPFLSVAKNVQIFTI